MPFEFRTMRATSDGFELEFTAPVDPETAGDPSSYRMESYTYELHSTYGSDEMDKRPVAITAANVAPGGTSVRLTVDRLRAGYVHELHLAGVHAKDGRKLLHAEAYYTLVKVSE